MYDTVESVTLSMQTKLCSKVHSLYMVACVTNLIYVLLLCVNILLCELKGCVCVYEDCRLWLSGYMVFLSDCGSEIQHDLVNFKLLGMLCQSQLSGLPLSPS